MICIRSREFYRQGIAVWRAYGVDAACTGYPYVATRQFYSVIAYHYLVIGAFSASLMFG